MVQSPWGPSSPIPSQELGAVLGWAGSPLPGTINGCHGYPIGRNYYRSYSDLQWHGPKNTKKCYEIILGYGSIPINTIFRGMNIHLPAILMWTTGVQGFDTLPYNITPITKVIYHCYQSHLWLLRIVKGKNCRCVVEFVSYWLMFANPNYKPSNKDIP